jgi:hypothetical protein
MTLDKKILEPEIQIEIFRFIEKERNSNADKLKG